MRPWRLSPKADRTAASKPVFGYFCLVTKVPRAGARNIPFSKLVHTFRWGDFSRLFRRGKSRPAEHQKTGTFMGFSILSLTGMGKNDTVAAVKSFEQRIVPPSPRAEREDGWCKSSPEQGRRPSGAAERQCSAGPRRYRERSARLPVGNSGGTADELSFALSQFRWLQGVFLRFEPK